MKIMEDIKVAVIGGGFAGLISAYMAAKKYGADKVRIFKKADGASSLFSGTFDIFGYNPITGDPLPNSKMGIEIAINNFPSHPYTIAGRTDDCTKAEDILQNTISRLNKAIKVFQELTNDLIAGDMNKNVLIPTTLGTFTVTAFYSPSMKEGILDTLHKKNVLIVGFKGYSDVYPDFVAKELKHRASKIGIDIHTSSKSVKIPGLSIESDLDPFSISRALDNDEIFKGFTATLKDTLSLKNVDKIALPPVLGYYKFRERYKELSEELGVDVFELVSPPPTIAGIRIIREIVKKAAIKTIRGDVFNYAQEGDKITSLKARDYGEEFTITAEKIVLATGKFISDGIIQHKKEIRERIFKLPVFDGKQWISEYTPMNFGRELFFDRKMHKVMKIGIKVNSEMRPLNKNDKIAFDNLFAAGSVIGGYNYPYEKNGFGVALLTAYIAGEKSM